MILGDRLPAPAQEAVLLAARAVLGAVFIAHGWQKLSTYGIDGTAASFDQLGVPAPEAAATFAAVVELGGGVLLVLGLLTPIVAVLLAADLAGAFWFAHRDHGVFAAEGGWELVAALAVGALLVGALGPGRLSLDRAIALRRG